jgi:sugar O-acyltransferase (sialic acid O-acetyltransferase NeuD family)
VSGHSHRSESGIYLAGTGSFAAEVAGWARDAGLELAGLVELLDARRVATTIHGLTVIAPEHAPPGATVAIAAGGDRGDHWALLAEHGWQAATIVHPAATVASSAGIGGGTVVGPGAIVGAETDVAEHVLISRGALVGHHTQIGSFVSLLPGANVASHVQLGAGTTVGMGGIVVDHTTIGAGATVAAGAVVLRPVDRGVRVQGVPARPYAP